MATPQTFKQARTQRERGVISSVLHAEQDHKGWCDLAFGKLCAFAQVQEQPWTVEEFRRWSSDHGLPTPEELRSFGGVTLRALHRKVIRRVGFAPTMASNGARRARYIGTHR